jgi:thiol-disulfide isomerase/thioredoxin
MLSFFSVRFWWVAVLWAIPIGGAMANELSLPGMDTPLVIDVVSAKTPPKMRLLWLPSEQGILPAEKQMAAQLSAQGYESWFANVYEPLFLAPTPSAVDEVPPEWISGLIQNAKSDGLPLIVIAPNKAAELAVRGWVALQAKPQHGVGFVLINPNLYINTPEPGEHARYWPEVSAFNAPVYVIQAALSPWRWHLMDLTERLQQSGSPVFSQVMPNMRDRFYFRPDASAAEQAKAKELYTNVAQASALLTRYLAEPRVAGKLETTAPVTVEHTKSTDLKVYSGAQDKPLQLLDLEGKAVNLKDYRGKVVLLNFWASWCPPCVHEIPSMTRLKTELEGQPFEILAVNLAEDRPAIDVFLKAHKVNFPILQDQSGSAVQTWQVFAYPSTYLIDRKGQIRYALFGGSEWDQPDPMTKIRALIAEPD